MQIIYWKVKHWWIKNEMLKIPIPNENENIQYENHLDIIKVSPKKIIIALHAYLKILARNQIKSLGIHRW